MKPYKDIDGDSGVQAYDYGDDWIKVQFKRGGTYEYRGSRIGSTNLAMLKRLADTGNGLNAFINTTPAVKTQYSSKS